MPMTSRSAWLDASRYSRSASAGPLTAAVVRYASPPPANAIETPGPIVAMPARIWSARDANAAVYVALPEYGARTSRVCAKPSPQPPNRYVAAPSDCGDGAVTVVAEHEMTVRVNGAATASLPNESRRPGGELAIVTSAVLGFSRTDVVEIRPSASVAVAVSSRYDGYS